MLSQEQIARLLRNCSLYDKTLLAIIYDCAQGSVRHEYIARYAYRVAITNSRILDVTDSNVLYDYKDYRKGGKHGVMTLYFVSFVAYFEIVASLFVYIVKRYKSVFSSTSCHFPFGNHTKTDIFPHNNQITFSTVVQQTGASFHLAGDTKPILFYIGK